MAAGDDATETAEVRQAASIVLIGELGDDTELGSLLRELLGRRGVELTLTRSPRFEPDALFTTEGPGALRVFIARRGEHDARLYFRAPGGERYLVRRLTLPSGLDAVGREAIGQVVESSTEALLDASQGVTREQATREIESDAPSTPAPAPAPRPAPAVAKPLPAPRAAQAAPVTKNRWEPRLRARYAAFWQGPDLGLRHGPGLGLGVLFDAGWLFGAELGGERFFEQSFSAPGVGARIDASDVFLDLDVGLTLAAGHRLLLGIGPRLEPLRVRGEAKDATVTPATTRSRVGFGLRLELGYEWTSRHLGAAFAAASDVALERIQYELLLPDGKKRSVAEIPSFRPGITLALSVR